jgi:hypothetical protein
MTEIYAILIGLFFGALSMGGVWWQARRRRQDAHDVRPPFTPPEPTTTPTAITEIDDDITPPGTKIADHVDWADDAR